MKKLLFFAGLLVLAMACNSSQSELKFQKKLNLAEFLMEENPDSSYQILQGMAEQVSSQQKPLQMEYQLLLANALNRADKVLPAPDEFRHVVEYYENSDDGNRHMLVCYLMGRTYLDNHEFPMATEYFQRVIIVADSMNSKCDYRTLYRTHSQLAAVYQEQRLFEKARREDSISAQIALDNGDTAMYMEFQEILLGDLNLLENPEDMLHKCEEVRHSYLKSGQLKAASRVHFYAVDPLVKKGRLREASEAIRDYEANSGYFDESGNLLIGNGLFYYYKGQYHLASNEWKNAEACFRKLVQPDRDANCHEAGYKGLLALYRQLGVSDSVGKYADLYCDMHDSSTQAVAAAEVGVIESLYDYNRNKMVAERKTRENGRLRVAIGVTVVLAVMCIALCVLIVCGLKRARTAESRRMRAELEEKKAEYELLMSDKDQLAQKYEADLLELESKLVTGQEHRLKRESLHTEVMENLLPRMRVMGENYNLPESKRTKVQGITNREWKMVDAYVESTFPELYQQIVDQRLSDIDSRIVFAMKLGLDDDAIRGTMQMHGNAFTNRKMRINEKLFAQRSASSLRRMVMAV